MIIHQGPALVAWVPLGRKEFLKLFSTGTGKIQHPRVKVISQVPPKAQSDHLLPYLLLTITQYTPWVNPALEEKIVPLCVPLHTSVHTLVILFKQGGSHWLKDHITFLLLLFTVLWCFHWFTRGKPLGDTPEQIRQHTISILSSPTWKIDWCSCRTIKSNLLGTLVPIHGYKRRIR